MTYLISMFIVFLILELPYVVLLIWGFILKTHEGDSTPEPLTYPDVVVALTCYSEGELIELAIESLAMQDYKGKITALVLVDGGSRFNRPTVEAGYRMQAKYPNIDVQVVDKPNRYGRVHSNNLGLKYCQENNIEYLLILDGDTSISLESISSFVRMAEHDKEVAGLSGSIKVRNLNSHITKLTYLEYALGIVLSRFSLGRLGYTNNISGAFGFFRVSSIAKIGGWRPNSGEDFDLTLRNLIHRNKIKHCENAIAYTDSPPTVWELIKQRWIWDGDYLFLISKYHHYLTPSIVGLRTWLFVWYNVVITISIPICVLIYTLVLFSVFPLLQALTIVVIAYIVYFYMSCILYALYIVLCEQKEISYDLLPYLLVQPCYSYFLRLNDIVAFCNELLFKQHLSSKMGPKRVLLRAHLERDDKYIHL